MCMQPVENLTCVGKPESDTDHKQVMEYGPLALDPFFFSRRIDGIDPNTSFAIYDVLKSEEYLDEGDLLRVDPRRSVRRAPLFPLVSESWAL